MLDLGQGVGGVVDLGGALHALIPTCAKKLHRRQCPQSIPPWRRALLTTSRFQLTRRRQRLDTRQLTLFMCAAPLHQDAAYYESLRADQEKAEAAERERREAEQAAAAAAAAAEAEERRQREETQRCAAAPSVSVRCWV